MDEIASSPDQVRSSVYCFPCMVLICAAGSRWTKWPATTCEWSSKSLLMCTCALTPSTANECGRSAQDRSVARYLTRSSIRFPLFCWSRVECVREVEFGFREACSSHRWLSIGLAAGCRAREGECHAESSWKDGSIWTKCSTPTVPPTPIGGDLTVSIRLLYPQGRLYRPSTTQRSMSPSKGVLFYGPPVLVRPCLPRPSRTSAMRTLRWVVSISHMFTSRCWLSAGSWTPHDVVQWIRSKCPRSFRLSSCCSSLRHVSWFTRWHHVLLGMMHLLYILGCLLLLGGFILHLTFDQLVARSEPRCELWNGAISDRSYPISYVIIIWSYTTTGDVFCIFFLRTKGDP